MTAADVAPTTVAADLGLQVRNLSSRIGATIGGVDLREATDEQVAAIRAIWLDRKVVFFPAQEMTPAEHVTFAARFGEPTEGHPVVPGLREEPTVFEIDYTLTEKLYATYGRVTDRNRGLDWHTDVTFVPRPPMGSILRAVEVPEAGGDTMFSNQVAAFEALSPTFQAFLSTLTAVHDGKDAFQGILDAVGEGRWDGEVFNEIVPSEHPVVRTHPETGERGLFVNPGFTTRIRGLARPESDAILAFLYEHSVRPEFTLRYHWGQGDVAFWDNRATQHSVVGDFGGSHRVIQRVTLRGDEPR